MRRGSIVALLGIGLVAGGVATAVAVIPTWLPADASVQAGRIDFTFWFVIGICIVLFAVVAAAMVYSVVKFRAAPDDLEDGPSIHGHTGLEIAWTAIPFVLVTAIAIVCGIVLSRNANAGPNPLIVNVTAQQYAWSFNYPDGNVTSPVLYLPVNKTVVLHMRSLDVIHAFFVPEFRENEDIVPGMVTEVVITPNRLTNGKPYPLECNELCGAGHTDMNNEVYVVSQAAFKKWLKQQKAGASG